MKKPQPSFDRRTADAIIRTDPVSFVERVFQTLSPASTCQRNWHIDAICHRMEQVRRGKIKRLIICVPPRALKSMMCSVAFPAYVLGHEPTKRIICVSYSADLAVRLSNDCREIMASPWYQRVFPGTVISRAKNTEEEFTTTRRGYRLSTSIEGTLTGRGGDIIIIDDPIKPNDALSDSKRERVNNAFFNTILSRLDDKRTGAIVVVMQRLHEDDLVGRLLRDAPGEWTVLSLPAIAEEEESVEIGDNKFHVRRPGDVLHAEREPRPILESYKAQLGSDTFAAQYQQRPNPREGAMIKRTWPRRYEDLPARDTSSMIVQSWDTANKDSKHAAYSVCTTWLLQGRNYFLVDVVRDRFDYPELKARATALAHFHAPKAILIEDVGIGSGLLRELQAAGLPAVAVKPILNKKTRMSIQSSKVESGKVFLPVSASWLEDFETELFSFPGGRYNDQVDSVSQALAYEMPSCPWLNEKALEGFGNLVEGLCFNRLVGPWY